MTDESKSRECAPDPLAFRPEVSAITPGSGRTGAVLLLAVDSCAGDPEAAVDESPVEVRVEVVASVPRGTGPSCADAVEVTLDAPLGDRRLVDDRTGNQVELLGEPATIPAGTMATGPLAAREQHVAVWTGEEMVVWGGALTGEPSTLPPLADDGAAYDPAAGAWRALAPSPLAPRGLGRRCRPGLG